MIERYHDRIDLQRMLANVPDHSIVDHNSNQPQYEEMMERIQRYYPDILFAKAHTGMEYQVADVTFTVLHTPDDMIDFWVKNRDEYYANWAGSDICIVENNGVDRPTLNFDVNKIQSVYDKVYQLVLDNPGAVDIGSEMASFKSGNVLFFNQTLGHLSGLTDMTYDYGVLPTPKFDTQQESYYSHLHSCTIWSIPTDARDPEMAAAVLTSLGYDSNRLTLIPHYEDLLKTRYVKDSESGYMIDLVYQNINMGFDSIYNEALGTSVSDKSSMPIFCFSTLLSANDGSSVSSWWIANQNTVKSKFDAMIDGFYD